MLAMGIALLTDILWSASIPLLKVSFATGAGKEFCCGLMAHFAMGPEWLLLLSLCPCRPLEHVCPSQWQYGSSPVCLLPCYCLTLIDVGDDEGALATWGVLALHVMQRGPCDTAMH